VSNPSCEEQAMDNDVEHKIRERAYELWVQAGQVPGRADEYWLQAEREVLGTPNEGDAGQTTTGQTTAPADPAVQAETAPARKTVARSASPKSPKVVGATRPKRSS